MCMNVCSINPVSTKAFRTVNTGRRRVLPALVSEKEPTAAAEPVQAMIAYKSGVATRLWGTDFCVLLARHAYSERKRAL